MAQPSKRRRGSSSPDGHPDSDRIQRQVAANEEEQRRIRDEYAELSSQLSAAQVECERLSGVVRHLGDVNSALKDRLEQQDRTKDLAAMKPVGLSQFNMQQDFEQVAMSLRDACSSVGIAIPPTSHDTSADAETWAQRAAQRSFRQLLDLVTDRVVEDFHIAQALAAASVSELVLESPFPDFLPWQSPLLDQYRSELLVRDGPQRLSQLDLLACHSVMSKEDFTSAIHRDAATLSETFRKALAHFISPNDDTMIGSEPHGPFSTTEDHCPESPVARVFFEAFVQALKLKRRLVLSRGTYKLVFFVPGDSFDRDTMRRIGEDSDFVHERVRRNWTQLSDASGSAIKLCLFPGLYFKPDDELTEDQVGVAVDRCLVNCHNFVREKELHGFTLVAKAYVLV